MKFPWELEPRTANLDATIVLVGANGEVQRCVRSIAARHCFCVMCFRNFGECEEAFHDRTQKKIDDATAKCFFLSVASTETKFLMPFEAISAQNRFCPAVLCVPQCSPKQVADVLRAGFADVLLMPLSEDSVDQRVAAIVEQSKILHCADQFHLRTQKLLDSLSARELMILDRIIQRLPIKRIAADLGTSPHTVRNQRRSILQKLDVEDDAELTYLMLSQHYVDRAESGLHVSVTVRAST